MTVGNSKWTNNNANKEANKHNTMFSVKNCRISWLLRPPITLRIPISFNRALANAMEILVKLKQVIIKRNNDMMAGTITRTPRGFTASWLPYTYPGMSISELAANSEKG